MNRRPFIRIQKTFRLIAAGAVVLMALFVRAKAEGVLARRVGISASVGQAGGAAAAIGAALGGAAIPSIPALIGAGGSSVFVSGPAAVSGMVLSRVVPSAIAGESAVVPTAILGETTSVPVPTIETGPLHELPRGGRRGASGSPSAARDSLLKAARNISESAGGPVFDGNEEAEKVLSLDVAPRMPERPGHSRVKSRQTRRAGRASVAVLVVPALAATGAAVAAAAIFPHFGLAAALHGLGLSSAPTILFWQLAGVIGNWAGNYYCAIWPVHEIGHPPEKPKPVLPMVVGLIAGLIVVLGVAPILGGSGAIIWGAQNMFGSLMLGFTLTPFSHHFADWSKARRSCFFAAAVGLSVLASCAALCIPNMLAALSSREAVIHFGKIMQGIATGLFMAMFLLIPIQIGLARLAESSPAFRARCGGWINKNPEGFTRQTAKVFTISSIYLGAWALACYILIGQHALPGQEGKETIYLVYLATNAVYFIVGAIAWRLAPKNPARV